MVLVVWTDDALLHDPDGTLVEIVAKTS